uniref:Uncharacterized protein n=1 Tax=Romanomermis culicivorax TaxID=13658 RepID=A0A915IN42_ROMCU
MSIFLTYACYNMSAAHLNNSTEQFFHWHLRFSAKANAIRFPDSRSAPVVADVSRGAGWYKLGGTVTVNENIEGPVYVYVESRNGTQAEPIECLNAKNGCGGVGSCIYCDICQSFKDDKASGKVELLNKGERLSCDKPLKPGIYNDVALYFQTPNLDEFLRSQKIDRKAWNDLVGKKGTTIYLSIYVFNEDIRKLSKAKLRERSMSLTNVLGCHRLVMDLSSD